MQDSKDIYYYVVINGNFKLHGDDGQRMTSAKDSELAIEHVVTIKPFKLGAMAAFSNQIPTETTLQ